MGHPASGCMGRVTEEALSVQGPFVFAAAVQRMTEACGKNLYGGTARASGEADDAPKRIPHGLEMEVETETCLKVEGTVAGS